MGTRLRDHSDVTPKPLVNIGNRPILWHLMDYYASFGHTEFILCLGYLGDQIKDYFFNFDPHMVDDVTLMRGKKLKGNERSGVEDWTITFVDTGLHSNIGERLMRVRRYLHGEKMFLANYADQLADLDLNNFIQDFESTGATAGFVSVKPPASFHAVDARDDGFVNGFVPMAESDHWLNGGFFALKPEVFDAIKPGNELVEEPFHRLAMRSKLWTKRHEGFWRPMDTFKDKIAYDRMWGAEDTPWNTPRTSPLPPDDTYQIRSAR